jgi:predicted HTH transcriptional regulator
LWRNTLYAARTSDVFVGRNSIFDDRIEIENPGLLPFGLTLEDLPRGISKLRNRVIGPAFHALGLVEQWGSGILRLAARMSRCRAHRPNA